MHILFESHPKIIGCLNTMSQKDRRSVDFSVWETDAEGYVHSVEIFCPEYSFEDRLLWDDAESNKGIEMSGMLPLDLQDWFDTNITGLWFYDARVGTDKEDRNFYKRMCFTFHFEKGIDAAHFKLRWS